MGASGVEKFNYHGHNLWETCRDGSAGTWWFCDLWEGMCGMGSIVRVVEGLQHPQG